MKIEKGLKHWNNLKQAEIEVQKALRSNDVDFLIDRLSCEAYDLTWYELHCEADRIKIERPDIEYLIAHIIKLSKDTLSKASWIRNKADKRQFPNARWLQRSRLKSVQFKLFEPWEQTTHPTENGTIILLERKLDGKIYIVGIPVTGVIAETE